MVFELIDCDGEGLRISCASRLPLTVDVIADAGGDLAEFARQVVLDNALLARWQAEKTGGAPNR